MAGPEIGGALLRQMLDTGRLLEGEDLRPEGADPLAAVPDLSERPPDPALLAALPPGPLFRHEAVPLRHEGEGVLFGGVRPDALPHLARLAEEAGLGPAEAHGFAAVTAAEVAEALEAVAPRQAEAALVRTAPEDSCRTLGVRKALFAALVLLAATSIVLAPAAALLTLVVLAAIALAASCALRLAAAVSAAGAPHGMPCAEPFRLPAISVLVPLFREDRVTTRLFWRLEAVDYPRDLLDVRLVTEADDEITARAISRSALPHWITVVRVPPGPVRTKPRALNYALDGCRGSIVGIWDAEDAPEAGQLRKVAAAFAAAPPDVGCLQGRLSLDATGRGWLARCFSLEYDGWFSVILPGLARLGLPVPLGGTTLFLRREAIEAVGAWDAHNVTEDADLGIRLHRRGWRTRLIQTVTVEEPPARVGIWVRQRSRWLKGYAATWAVHSRRPGALTRDLGPGGALAFHVLIAGTLLQFTLAPLFWLLWPAALGWTGPLDGLIPAGLRYALIALALLSEATGLAVYVLAARRVGTPAKAWLGPTMLLYFPLATLAAWKAVVELVVAPFYWDKTDHD